MATYSRRILQVERVEFHVPTPAPWGATWTEVVKAVTAATTELRDHGILAEGQTPADDQIRIAPSDDGIVVSVEIRTRSTDE